MISYIQIIRPLNGIMSSIAVWIGTIIAGMDFIPELKVIFGMLAVFLISSAGMVVNDIADINIDKINRPKRPLPTGKITKNKAIIYAIILFIVGNIIAFIIGESLFYIAIIASVLLILYAAKLKKIIMLGHIVISILVALTFVFGGVIAGNYFITLPLALLAFLSNVGREIYKSIEDVMGDKSVNIDTLAIRFGVLKAKIIASIFLFVAIGFSFLPYVIGILGSIYLFFVIIADIIFLGAIISPVRYSAKICKIAMFIALIAFIVGVL
ncbi:MAG: UbiA family prenyltransferase [Candidatus Aenigmatarchaeota archaeon]